MTKNSIVVKTDRAEDTSKGQPRTVRPTIRCLLEDLPRDVEAGEMRDALKAAGAELEADPMYLFPEPLEETPHPVLRKANSLAADPGSDRVQIKTIADRHLIKVKTGPYRAAMWQDEHGRWWLLAAGRRRDDGPGDFYRELEKHGNDSSAIAPTQRDRDYLRFETAYRKECDLERMVHADVLSALLEAAAAPGTRIALEVLGAEAGLRIEPDEGGLAVVEVTWRMVEYTDQQRFPADLLAMVPGGQNIEDWECLGSRPGSDSGPLWYMYVTDVWVRNLAVSAELDELAPLATNWAPQDPVSDGSENYSHWAEGSAVTRAYIEGIEIVGLCGARVVAHRDYENLPVCERCDESFALLRHLRDVGESR